MSHSEVFLRGDISDEVLICSASSDSQSNLAEAKPFESEEDDKGQDEKFLQLLKKSVTGTTKGEKGKTRLHELDLLERNVAKVAHLALDSL